MIVLDASAVVGLLLAEAPEDELVELVASQELHAPTLIDYEVASAVRGLARGGKIESRRIDEVVRGLAQVRIQRHPLGPVTAGVLALRDDFTAYDAAYVLLADALEAVLVTTDQKMTTARELGVDVQLVRSAA